MTDTTTRLPPTVRVDQPSLALIPRGRFWSGAIRLLAARPIGFEEERRRLLFGLASSVSCLMLVTFGIYHLVEGPVIEGFVNLALAVVLVAGVIALRELSDGTVVYRGIIILFGLLFVFFGTLGEVHGHRALWALTLPSFALLVAGPGFGATVSVATLGAWILFFVLPPEATGAALYDAGFSYRFLATFVTILAMALFSEQVHRKYSEAMVRYQRSLELANGDLKASEELMRRMAMVDALTGIPNRRAILSQLDNEALRARRANGSLTIALLDIDHFKRINDTFGHPVGDAVLQECARRISIAMRSYDSVGRYGGEEFLIVLPEAGPDDVGRILERVRREIADNPFLVGGTQLKVTASIGTASSNALELRPDVLIGSADQALYWAKDQGRNRVRRFRKEEPRWADRMRPSSA